MRVLITGGAGFIGSHLARRLLENNHTVAVIDNLSTGSIENIQSFKNNKRFDFCKADILDSSVMERLVENCDMIYHLAAAVGVQLIADQPVRTIETNIGGTEVVLNTANKFKKKILIASSSEIYGKSEKIPFCEDDDIVLGNTSFSRWSYACSKAIDEFLGLAFYQQYDLEVVIARFFNTIGPGQTGKYGMVVPRFVHWALLDKPLLIYGTGQQTRCFCCVDDVIDAVIGLMSCPKAVGRVCNIGSNDEITIEQLADKIIKMTASKSEKQFISYRKAYGRDIDDLSRRVPSLERIKHITGWSPQISLDETLRIIIAESRKSVQFSKGLL